MEIGLYLIVFCFSLFLVISLIRFFYFGHKFGKLLKDKHIEEWKELTTIPGFGPGCSNPFRGLPFLFSNEDFGDKELLDFKIKFRSSLIYIISGTIALVITMDRLIRYSNELR